MMIVVTLRSRSNREIKIDEVGWDSRTNKTRSISTVSGELDASLERLSGRTKNIKNQSSKNQKKLDVASLSPGLALVDSGSGIYYELISIGDDSASLSSPNGALVTVSLTRLTNDFDVR